MNGCQVPHFGLARQYVNLKDELLDATHNALKDGQFVAGKFTKEFEIWLALKCKANYAITVHSCTQALEIIARYKKQKHHDIMVGNPKIRIPNLTYPATLNAFINAGWDVELADTDKYGILVNDDTVQYACLVGLYGRFPQHKDSPSSLYFNSIVDGAQHWLVAGGMIGSGMAISFDPTKNLPSSGNGGAIVTNDVGLYNFAINYRDNGKSSNFSKAGTNSKMSEQDCAQILVRTKYIDAWQERRAKIAKYWYESFSDLPLTCLSDDSAPNAHQKFVVFTANRNSLHTHLLTSGIDAKRHYEYTLGDLPISKDLVKPDLLSTSVMLSRGVLSLPMFPELTDNEVSYICESVTSFYK